MRVVFETPILSSVTSKGLGKFWRGYVAELETGGIGHGTITYQTLADGSSSKQNTSAITVVKGKNIGRANETTPLQQAIAEIESKANKKRDAGYRAEGEEAVVLQLPMLAMKYVQRKHNLVYPLCVQPKLDGVRMVYNMATGEGWSRLGKPFLPEILQSLNLPAGDLVLDGELMLPDRFHFDDSISAAKKYYTDPQPAKHADDYWTSDMLIYHVFDYITVDDIPFSERLEALKELPFDLEVSKMQLVPTYIARNADEAMSMYGAFLGMGYEGIMFRNMDGLYTVGQRSKDLQKLKPFYDGEYRIVGAKDGVGREAGAIIYICEALNGAQFDCRSEGSVAGRQKAYQEYLADPNTLVGKMLTVTYQSLGENNIPRFPVGKTIRDYE